MMKALNYFRLFEANSGFLYVDLNVTGSITKLQHIQIKHSSTFSIRYIELIYRQTRLSDVNKYSMDKLFIIIYHMEKKWLKVCLYFSPTIQSRHNIIVLITLFNIKL